MQAVLINVAAALGSETGYVGVLIGKPGGRAASLLKRYSRRAAQQPVHGFRDRGAAYLLSRRFVPERRLAVVLEHKNAQRRREIGAHATSFDFEDELIPRDVHFPCNFYECFPELVFHADARLPAPKRHGSLSNR